MVHLQSKVRLEFLYGRPGVIRALVINNDEVVVLATLPLYRFHHARQELRYVVSGDNDPKKSLFCLFNAHICTPSGIVSQKLP